MSSLVQTTADIYFSWRNIRVCFLNYVVKVSDASQSLNETGRPLNVSELLPTASADDVRLVEGQSMLKQLQSLKFLFGIHRPTVSKKGRSVF